MHAEASSARSMLFVPGHRPDRYAKAASSGADAIVLDLEDAVAPEDKDAARQSVDQWLAAGGEGVVRINGADTPCCDADLAMVRNHRCPVLLPKVTAAEQVRDALEALPGTSSVIVLLESAAAILHAETICAVPKVVRAAFGSADLAAELGIDPDDHDALRHARCAVVLASAAAGVAPPLDGVTTQLGETDRLAADTARAAHLGFTGKLCIHPAQIGEVHRVLAPTDRDILWAQAIVGADTAGDVVVVAGQMIDKPLVDRAHRILATAHAVADDRAAHRPQSGERGKQRTVRLLRPRNLVRLPKGRGGPADLRQLPPEKGMRARSTGHRGRRRRVGWGQPAWRAHHAPRARRSPQAVGIHRLSDGPPTRVPPPAHPGHPRRHALRSVSLTGPPRQGVGKCLIANLSSVSTLYFATTSSPSCEPRAGP